MSRATVAGGLIALILAPTIAGCSGAEGEAPEVLVSAAASLTDVFGAIETEFEQRNPDLDVVLNLGGSSALREQILAGAPADVFASADEPNMATIVESGAALGAPVVFATNRMEIAVPPGNPGGVTGLADFENEALVLGLCAAEVPCGELARMALGQADVAASIDTNEPNVRALLTKIEVGELDAGIVYVTDIGGAQVEGIPISSSDNATTSYPMVVLADGASPDAGRAFVDFVLSEPGRGILAEFGFSQ